MNRESAEELALAALGYIVASEELGPIFLGSTGASADDLRNNASSPEFLCSVLEFLTMDDRWVIGFCDATGRSYDEPMAAKAALPGGAEVSWT